MTTEEDAELKRQSKLLESLEGMEAFRLWRKEIVDPQIAMLEAKLVQSEQQSEAVLRGTILARYLLQDVFHSVFDRIKVTNEQDREINK